MCGKMKIPLRNTRGAKKQTVGCPSNCKLASLIAVMPVSCPFMCTRAWEIRSCKLPVSSWKPQITNGSWRDGSEGYHDNSRLLIQSGSGLKMYRVSARLLSLLLFFLLQTCLERSEDLGAVARHPQNYTRRL